VAAVVLAVVHQALEETVGQESKAAVAAVEDLL
jgi:hypothetical protein